MASPSLDLLREHLRSVMPEARWSRHEPIARPTPEQGPVWRSDRRSCLDTSSTRRRSCWRSMAISSVWRKTAAGISAASRAGRRIGKTGRPDEPALCRREPVFAHRRDGRPPAPARRPAMCANTRLALAREVSRLPMKVVPPARGAPAGRLCDQALPAYAGRRSTFDGPWIREVAADLRAHAGKGVIVAGRRQPPLVHALVHAMNAIAGQHSARRSSFASRASRPAVGNPRGTGRGDRQGTGRDPAHPGRQSRVYTAPADLDFADADQEGPDHDPPGATRRRDLAAGDLAPSRGALPGVVGRRPHRRRNSRADPAADRAALRRTRRARGARAAARRTRQPLPTRSSAAPSGRSAAATGPGSRPPGASSCTRDARRLGAIQSCSRRSGATLIGNAIAAARPTAGPLSAANLELVLDRDAKVDDGRFANNGWLQELPDPITKLTWDNAALFSPKTAQALGVADRRPGSAGPRRAATWRSRPWSLPGQADYSVAVALGYGRTAAGRVGNGVGFNAYVAAHHRRRPTSPSG